MGTTTTSTAHEAVDIISMVRSGDYERFLAIQLAPPAKREALYAVTACALEVACIAEQVSEPLIGHIRLAWWREALEEMMAGAPPRQHPVVIALAAVHSHAPQVVVHLLQMVDARAVDLDTSLLAEESAWLAYCDNTAGALHMAWAALLDENAATVHATTMRAEARAYAMIGLARAIPFMAAQGWMRFSDARLAAHGVASLAPSTALNGMVQAIVNEANAMMPKTALPRSLKPLSALARVAALHSRWLRLCGGDPYAVRPKKLGIVWEIMKLNIMQHSCF